MARPKMRNSRPITFSLSEDVIRLIEEHRKNLPSSYFVEEAIIAAVKGQSRVIELSQSNLEIEQQLKRIQEERDRLARENERLTKKVAKLEAELEKWRKKWDGQKTLDKWERKINEKRRLAEKLIPHIEEGLTWEKVCIKAGIIETGVQIDIFNTFFRQVHFRSSYEYLASQYLPSWVIRWNHGSTKLKAEFVKAESVEESVYHKLEDLWHLKLQEVEA